MSLELAASPCDANGWTFRDSETLPTVVLGLSGTPETMILTEKALSGLPDTRFLVKKPLSGSLDALPTGENGRAVTP